jgi:hypothetical protein
LNSTVEKMDTYSNSTVEKANFIRTLR